MIWSETGGSFHPHRLCVTQLPTTPDTCIPSHQPWSPMLVHDASGCLERAWKKHVGAIPESSRNNLPTRVTHLYKCPARAGCLRLNMVGTLVDTAKLSVEEVTSSEHF